jgi:hypothetical protein
LAYRVLGFQLDFELATGMNFSDRIADLHQKMRHLSHEASSRHPNHGPCAVFHHLSTVHERLRDLELIYSRLIENRAALKKACLVEDHLTADKLTHAMKYDFESLLLFGNVLLDQACFTYEYLVGDCRPKLKTFSELAKAIPDGVYRGNLSMLSPTLCKEMIWLHLQVTLHTNRLIKHADRPWQRGQHHSLMYDDFHLFTPAAVGSIDEKAVVAEIRGLIHLAPAHIQMAPAYRHPRDNPRALLEILIENIGDIADAGERERVRQLAYTYGFSTPTFQKIASTILDFATHSADLVDAYIAANPGNIVLGQFKHHVPFADQMEAFLLADMTLVAEPESNAQPKESRELR